MYLSGLSGREQEAFLQLARMMIAADGVIAPEEEEMFADLHEELGAQQKPADAIVDLHVVCQQVEKNDSRAKMLLELASLAFVDGNYAKREKALLREIGELWGIELFNVLRSEEWGKRRIAMATEAISLIQEMSL